MAIKKAPPMLCEPGAVVVLKSGGPRMTVTGVTGEAARVRYFDNDGGHHGTEFPIKCLTVLERSAVR